MFHNRLSVDYFTVVLHFPAMTAGNVADCSCYVINFELCKFSLTKTRLGSVLVGISRKPHFQYRFQFS